MSSRPSRQYFNSSFIIQHSSFKVVSDSRVVLLGAQRGSTNRLSVGPSVGGSWQRHTAAFGTFKIPSTPEM